MWELLSACSTAVAQYIILMNRYAMSRPIRRHLSDEQRAVCQRFADLLSRGNGPRNIPKLAQALMLAGVEGCSSETLSKAARGDVAFPIKYAEPIMNIYKLVGTERAEFAGAVLIASASPEAVALYRRSSDGDKTITRLVAESARVESGDNN